MEPGDGTGHSIADAQSRNAQGLCAMFNCGKPMNRENEWTVFGGVLCDECPMVWANAMERMVQESAV